MLHCGKKGEKRRLSYWLSAVAGTRCEILTDVSGFRQKRPPDLISKTNEVVFFHFVLIVVAQFFSLSCHYVGPQRTPDDLFGINHLNYL